LFDVIFIHLLYSHIFLAMNTRYCADVPLRHYSLTHFAAPW